jgi:ESS family glutamate:Na+ symporter
MFINPRQTIIVAILVLFLGKYLNRKILFLRKYNIPEPVSGGLIASIIFGFIFLVFHIDIEFSTYYRDILLVVFFTAIGLSTELQSIIKGGKILFILIFFAVSYIFIQNYLGIFLADIFNENKGVGIIAGSAALQGGHGNIVSWAPVIEKEFNAKNMMEIGMISATFGLIIGGILGGPVSRFLIAKYNLKPDNKLKEINVTIGAKHGKNLVIDYHSILSVLLLLALSIGIGLYIHKLLDMINFTLPLFATCMLGGVILANISPLFFKDLKDLHVSPTLSIASDLSLGLFLAMAMMSLKFWEIGDESLYIIVNILLQTVAVVLFSVFILFRFLGKNYDAAVITAGYIGSVMGATPTAMANMAAVTKKYGASPVAFAVIPIVGAFIIQVSNAFVINILILLLQ